MTYTKAAIAYDSGDLTAAASLAREALAEDPVFLPAMVVLGKAAFFSGDTEGAVSALERAERYSPRSGTASLWLARAYRQAGRDSDARLACRRLLTADPDCVAALRLAADIELDDEEAGAAMAFLDRAAEAAGETGLAFADRAALRWASGNVDGAVRDLEAAVATLPCGSSARAAAETLLERIRESRR